MDFWKDVYKQIQEMDGGVDRFLDKLIEKQGLSTETTEPQPKRIKHECLTVTQLIEKLEYMKTVQGGDALVYMEDTSGYDSDVCGATVDHDVIVLRMG